MADEPLTPGEDTDDGPTVTWLPEPGRGIRLPDGRTVHKGVLFVPDETGGGVLYGRSKTTMKWTRRIGSAKPYTGGRP